MIQYDSDESYFQLAVFSRHTVSFVVQKGGGLADEIQVCD